MNSYRKKVLILIIIIVVVIGEECFFFSWLLCLVKSIYPSKRSSLELWLDIIAAADAVKRTHTFSIKHFNDFFLKFL